MKINKCNIKGHKHEYVRLVSRPRHTTRNNDDTTLYENLAEEGNYLGKAAAFSRIL